MVIEKLKDKDIGPYYLCFLLIKHSNKHFQKEDLKQFEKNLTDLLLKMCM